jgi:hypothetical protein
MACCCKGLSSINPPLLLRPRVAYRIFSDVRLFAADNGCINCMCHSTENIYRSGAGSRNMHPRYYCPKVNLVSMGTYGIL